MYFNCIWTSSSELSKEKKVSKWRLHFLSFQFCKLMTKKFQTFCFLGTSGLAFSSHMLSLAYFCCCAKLNWKLGWHQKCNLTWPWKKLIAVKMYLQSIVESPTGQLKLGEIYTWFSNNFKHFRTTCNLTWKVTIKTKLSFTSSIFPTVPIFLFYYCTITFWWKFAFPKFIPQNLWGDIFL